MKTFTLFSARYQRWTNVFLRCLALCYAKKYLAFIPLSSTIIVDLITYERSVCVLEEIKKLFIAFPKKTVSLLELEQVIKPFIRSYEEFAQVVLELEAEGILGMVKAKGRNSRNPSLAFQYRIQKKMLVDNYHKELQSYRRNLHPSINLDAYYQEEPNVWKKHLPYIQKIDQYLQKFSFPTEEVPAPERSYELVEDEKWIVEKGGKEILEKIGLFHSLKIIPVSEPLMFAINPMQITVEEQFHLIVENKTTFQGLLPVLKETKFSTLIYGSGKAVIKSIEQFPMQYPVIAKHYFFYFGDIDHEGISIWYSLNEKQNMILALPFYEACLHKKSAMGKAYQKSREIAFSQFLSYFPLEQQLQIQRLLEDGCYYPQETLKTKELQQIWRESNWTSLNYKK